MKQETQPREPHAPTIKRIDFVSPDSLQNRRLFASQLIQKRQRFRRLFRWYATTGVIALSALAFMFD